MRVTDSLLRLTERLSLRSTYNSQTVALALKGGNVVGWGVNGWRGKAYDKGRNSRGERHPRTQHAEEHLVEQYGDRLQGCKVLVIRQTASGELAMAKPCTNICAPLLAEYGVRRITYSTEGGFNESAVV